MQISEKEIREAFASEMADILHRQKTIVACNRSLGLLTDEKVKDEFKTMAQEDEKNLRLLDTVIGNFGIRVEPKNAALKIAELMADIVSDRSSQPLEKLGAYTILKQNQALAGQLLHKSAQVSQPDIKTSLSMFDGISAAFSRHVVTLTAFIEQSGFEWVTGKRANAGFLDLARDALSTVSGAIRSKTAKPAEEIDVLAVLEVDHRKVEALFKEVNSAQSHQEKSQLFQQIKADLTSHSLAEEETVYRRFSSLKDMQELMADAKQEHEDMRLLLDEITDDIGNYEIFSDKLDDLRNLVQHHVAEEENKIFNLMTRHSTDEERIQLSRRFMQAKQKIQENVGSDEIVSSAGQENDSSLQRNPPM